MSTLSTADEIIATLGGARKLAEDFEVSANAVHNWRAFNKFPSRTYLSMTYELKKLGYSASPQLWGMA